MSLDSMAKSYERMAEYDASKAARHALLGNHGLARIYAELAIESRANARDTRATAHTKYTGEDLYASAGRVTP